MRIPCPYCGEREVSEFTYLGDADYARPDPQAADAPLRYYEAVYVRENPAGPHDELWFHGQGCRLWLKVKRDTRTHEILAVACAANLVEAG